MRLSTHQQPAPETQVPAWVPEGVVEETTPSDERWQAWLALDVLVAVLLALLSLRTVASSDLTEYGLPPALPISWYLALAMLVLSAVLVLSLRQVRSWLAALHLIGLVVVLYGSGVILADAPRFAWSYKHIGVTNYITEFGRIDPDIDIYHRWPGFFSLASTFGAVAGLPDALAYAAWAGVFFVLLECMLVVAIARTLLGSSRAGWAAGLIFACTNFVGQDYFAPQPFAFVLALGVLWVALLHFRTEPGGRLAGWLTRAVAWVARAEAPDRLNRDAEPLWGRRTALAVVFVMFAAIVPSHQLTPYIVVLVLTLIAAVKGLRPWWLVLVLGGIALLYLGPNYRYLVSTYQVFSGLDPFSNAESVNDLTYVQPGKVLSVRAGQALALLLGLAAAVSFVMAWRSKRVGVAHAGLAFVAPFVILVALRYGGEGGLRVFLFAAPWAAVLIASLVVRHRPERNFLLVPLMALFLTLFLPAYYGVEHVNRIPRSEAAASQFLNANGRSGSVVVASAPNFPSRIGSRYPELRGESGTASPVLTRRDEFRAATLGPGNVNSVVNVIRRSSSTGYVVFSESQETYAKVFGLSSADRLRSLESAMLASGRFRLFYQNATTRIYELQG